MSVFSVPCGRLTLTPGIAAPASDVAAAVEVYYVSVGGNGLPVSDGTSVVVHELSAPLALTLDYDATHSGYQQGGNIYDVFAFINNGALALGTGPAWASATAGLSSRGTGEGTTELSDSIGLLVNKNAISLRFGAGAADTADVPASCATYLGSIRPIADGVAADSASRRLLFNAYNPVTRGIRARGPSTNYVYSSAAYRVQGGDANTRVDVLLGLSGVWVSASASAYVSADVQSGVFVAVGLNSMTTPSRDCAPAVRVGSLPELMESTFGAYVPMGYNFIASLEKGSGAGTQTWLGSDDGHGLIGCYAG